MDKQHKTVTTIVPDINEKYETPFIEIIEVRVERGFTESNLDSRSEEATY